jgi:uncharacterized protein
MPAIRNHPFTTFLVIAFGFAWSMWLLEAFYPHSTAFIPSPTFGPLIAALIVLMFTHGRSGVRELLGRMVRWRVGLGWYAAAFLLPTVLALVAVYTNVLLMDAAAPSGEELGKWPLIVLLFPLLLVFDGPLGEEPGWRGFALPRLQAGRSALVASLVLGVIVVLWHVPKLILDPTFRPVPFALFTIAGAVLFTWIYNSTNGSVLLTTLFHGSINAIGGQFFFSMFSGEDLTKLWWLTAAAYCAAAIVVVAVAGPEHLSREHNKEEERAQPAVATSTPRVV